MIQRSPRNRAQAALPGIIGGLGPLAHIEFERRLIDRNVQRGACCDQDHPVWILVNAANVPDRTRSLKNEVEDCTPWLLKYGHLLERAGTDFLVVTCNSAHAFYSGVQTQLSIPWLHLMDCTAYSIREQFPDVRRVGFLATDGTVQMNLYSASLQQFGLQPICPPLGSPTQNQVMQSIYAPGWGIKSSGVWVSDMALQTIEAAMVWLQKQGAELVIAGCTELSVAIAKLKKTPLPWIDPLDVVAELTLELVSGQRQLHSILAA